jgi:hypothetical protein
MMADKYGSSPLAGVLEDCKLLNRLLAVSLTDIHYAPFRCKMVQFEEDQ